MTNYAGETYQVRHYALGYQKEDLTDDEVTVVITIWDLDDTVLVDDEAMQYDATLVFEDDHVGGWFYIWESPTVAGAYLARFTATGSDIDAVEFKTLRLRRSKEPVTP
jgi:hypothetical protein